MKQLKQFQKIGVDFMLNRKTALLADDMGLGKTAQAAGVIDRLNPKRALSIKYYLRQRTKWIRTQI